MNAPTMPDPPWLARARTHIGTREIPGVRHEPKILQWWRDIRRGGIKSESVPWCAAFVGAMLEQSGLISSRFESARSYLTWGKSLTAPALGCIVVLGRQGGGHVGFLVGIAPNGWLQLLGGNQSDAVTIAAFDPARVLGYRWPEPVPLPINRAVPTLTAVAPSTREA